MKRWAIFLTLDSLLFFVLMQIGWAAENVAQGKATYQKLCVPCHGVSGKGNGPASANLEVKPRNHMDRNAISHLTDQNIFDVIKGGGLAVQKSHLMPPFAAALKDDQIWDVMAYVRSLSNSKKK